MVDFERKLESSECIVVDAEDIVELKIERIVEVGGTKHIEIRIAACVAASENSEQIVSVFVKPNWRNCLLLKKMAAEHERTQRIENKDSEPKDSLE